MRQVFNEEEIEGEEIDFLKTEANLPEDDEQDNDIIEGEDSDFLVSDVPLEEDENFGEDLGLQF